jgi:hypothetical protein
MKHARYETAPMSMTAKMAELAHEQKETKELERKYDNIENVAGWIESYRDKLKKGFDTKPTLMPEVPKSKRVTLEDLRHHGFFINIWDMEPLLVDALEHAKDTKNETQKLLMRGYLRAASWSTHRPVNPEVARADAEYFLTESQERESGERLNPFAKQKGFGFDEEAATRGWEQVAVEVGTMDCKGDRVETATEFVEKQFVKEWKSFLRLYKEKGVKRTWPDRGVDVKLEPEVAEAVERITKMREIRDQLYYQRLYPKLCEFGHQGIKKRSA